MNPGDNPPVITTRDSDAFEELKEKAALEHRLGFARRVLRTELLVVMLFGQVPSDTPSSHTYTHTHTPRASVAHSGI